MEEEGSYIGQEDRCSTFGSLLLFTKKYYKKKGMEGLKFSRELKV
jgi:hypothetical protein